MIKLCSKFPVGLFCSKSTFAIWSLLGGLVMADGAISIEDLEEIPREEWPDLTSPEFQI